VGLKSDPPASYICPATGKERMTRGAAKSMAKRRRGHSVNLQAFKCPECKGWHVGNIRWR
jgi:predicted RNA-binding Zn-ribbon protein involved in translation (DUF1610 family)